MKEPNEPDKIKDLHDCNSEIYKIIHRLKEIDAPVRLAYQKLKDATKEIQTAIGTLLDDLTETKEQKNDTNNGRTE